MKRFFLPLALFFLLMVLLAIGLHRDPHELPSPFIGKQAPSFTLNQLEQEQQHFSPHDMLGKVWILNVWASWCVACREEQPVLLEFSRQTIVPVVGLDYKDRREEGRQWLQRYGNPYQLSAFDDAGMVGIDYGVYGVPETFVIDRLGIVRYKHVGGLTAEFVQRTLLPLLNSLKND